MFYCPKNLDGLKLDIYVLLKILKLCVPADPKVTSYEAKFAVLEQLGSKDPTKEEIGKCIDLCLKHYMLRDKFSGLKKD